MPLITADCCQFCGLLHSICIDREVWLRVRLLGLIILQGVSVVSVEGDLGLPPLIAWDSFPNSVTPPTFTGYGQPLAVLLCPAEGKAFW